MPIKSRFLDSVADEAAWAIGPEPRLTLFHIGTLLTALGGLNLGLALGFARWGGVGLLIGPALGLAVGWFGGGLLFGGAALASALLLHCLYRRGWLVRADSGCDPWPGG